MDAGLHVALPRRGPTSAPSTKTSTFASGGALTTRCPVDTSGSSGPATVASSPPLSFTSLRIVSKPRLRHGDHVRSDVGAERTGERRRPRVVVVERHRRAELGDGDADGAGQGRQLVDGMLDRAPVEGGHRAAVLREEHAVCAVSVGELLQVAMALRDVPLEARARRDAVGLLERGERLAERPFVVELEPGGEELLGRRRDRPRWPPEAPEAPRARVSVRRTRPRTIASAATSERARIDAQISRRIRTATRFPLRRPARSDREVGRARPCSADATAGVPDADAVAVAVAAADAVAVAPALSVAVGGGGNHRSRRRRRRRHGRGDPAPSPATTTSRRSRPPRRSRPRRPRRRAAAAATVGARSRALVPLTVGPRGAPLPCTTYCSATATTRAAAT